MKAATKTKHPCDSWSYKISMSLFFFQVKGLSKYSSYGWQYLVPIINMLLRTIIVGLTFVEKIDKQTLRQQNLGFFISSIILLKLMLSFVKIC